MPLSDRIRSLVNKYSGDQDNQRQRQQQQQQQPHGVQSNVTQYPGQQSYQMQYPAQQPYEQQAQTTPYPYQMQYPVQQGYQQQHQYAHQNYPPQPVQPETFINAPSMPLPAQFGYGSMPPPPVHYYPPPPHTVPQPEISAPVLPPRPQGSRPAPPPKPPRTAFAGPLRSGNTPPVPSSNRDNLTPQCAPISQQLPGWSSTDPQTLFGKRVVHNNYKVSPDLIDQNLSAKPVPTNAWWQNLIVEAGDQPVVSSPYMVKCLKEAIVVCAPTPLVENKFVASVWHDDWRLATNAVGRKVCAFDAFSVHVKYDGPVSAYVPIVRGAPFVTAVFEEPAPLKLTTIHAITNVDTAQVPPGCAVVTLNDGRTWLVCCEQPVRLCQDGHASIVSDQPIAGVVRIALVNIPATGVPALLETRDVVAISGDVHIDTTETEARFTVSWKTHNNNPNPPLICAFAHHQMKLANAHWDDRVGHYWSCKGQMRAVRGAQWQWTEDIEPLGFSGAACQINESDRQKLCELVRADAQALPATTEHLPRDPYFFGKAAARATRIALIADEVGELASRDLAIQRVTSWLNPWIQGTNLDPLLFDAEWHGVISTDGYNDSNADFGQGRYNDHHFHYGYFVYAAAVLAKLSPEWVAERREQLDLFARDYCNPSTLSDPHFPAMRNFDFFDGHSWAAGLFAFADSRNQESTSEAINAYYAAYLYALATGRTQIAQYMRAILQLEARTSRIYWHINDEAEGIYPETYAGDKAIIGILWSGKCDFATFFSADPACIYGIQFLPYTPATALLLKRRWIADIWPKYLERVAVNAETEPWREIIELAGAVDDKQRTFQRTAAITNRDDGNSASNSYYWIATAPN